MKLINTITPIIFISTQLLLNIIPCTIWIILSQYYECNTNVFINLQQWLLAHSSITLISSVISCVIFMSLFIWWCVIKVPNSTIEYLKNFGITVMQILILLMFLCYIFLIIFLNIWKIVWIAIGIWRIISCDCNDDLTNVCIAAIIIDVISIISSIISSTIFIIKSLEPVSDNIIN